jgi:hypothetical protein
MARKAKQEAKPLPSPAKPRQRTAPAKPVLSKTRQQPTKPRQQRKRKVTRVDELVLLDRVLDYLGNFLLLMLVSAIIVALAYFFMNAFG